MIYSPILAITEENEPRAGMPFEESFIQSVNGVQIHVWIVWASAYFDSRTTSTIVFCHSNAGNMGKHLNRAVLLAAETCSNVVLWDYRGYGSSTGSPSEKGIRADAIALSRWLVARGDIDTRKVFWDGVSFGGAVAAHAVADTLNDTNASPSAGLILENTFTSILDMAIAPILSPVKMLASPLVRDKWDTASIASLLGSSVPTLFISSSNDWKVWPHHMKKLHQTFTSAHVTAREALRVDQRATARDPPKMHTFRAGHMDIPNKMPGGWAGCIEEFINKTLRNP